MKMLTVRCICMFMYMHQLHYVHVSLLIPINNYSFPTDNCFLSKSLYTIIICEEHTFVIIHVHACTCMYITNSVHVLIKL